MFMQLLKVKNELDAIKKDKERLQKIKDSIIKLRTKLKTTSNINNYVRLLEKITLLESEFYALKQSLVLKYPNNVAYLLVNILDVSLDDVDNYEEETIDEKDHLKTEDKVTINIKEFDVESGKVNNYSVKNIIENIKDDESIKIKDSSEENIKELLDVKEEIKEEVKKEDIKELKEKVKKEDIKELKEKVKKEVKKEEIIEVREEDIKEVKEDSKEEVKEEIKEEIIEVKKEDIKEEIKEEVKKDKVEKDEVKGDDVKVVSVTEYFKRNKNISQLFKSIFNNNRKLLLKILGEKANDEFKNLISKNADKHLMNVFTGDDADEINDKKCNELLDKIRQEISTQMTMMLVYPNINTDEVFKFLRN